MPSLNYFGIILADGEPKTLMSVMGVPELCEMVFLNLEPDELLVAVDIDRSTRSLVLTSPSLRNKIFLPPAKSHDEKRPNWTKAADDLWMKSNDNEIRQHHYPIPDLHLFSHLSLGKVFSLSSPETSEWLYEISWSDGGSRPSGAMRQPRSAFQLMMDDFAVRQNAENPNGDSASFDDPKLRLTITRWPNTFLADKQLVLPDICLEITLTDPAWPIHISVGYVHADSTERVPIVAFVPAGRTFGDVLAWTNKRGELGYSSASKGQRGILELPGENTLPL